MIRIIGEPGRIGHGAAQSIQRDHQYEEVKAVRSGKKSAQRSGPDGHGLREDVGHQRPPAAPQPGDQTFVDDLDEGPKQGGHGAQEPYRRSGGSQSHGEGDDVRLDKARHQGPERPVFQ